jgi:CHAT domain-containing protein
MDATSVYNLLSSGSLEEQRRFLEEWLPDDIRASVLPIMTGGEPGLALVALGLAAVRLCGGQNPEAGAPLALGLHQYGVELLGSGRSPTLQLSTVSLLAFQYANASNLLGRSGDVVTFADQWIPIYEKLGEAQNLPSLKSARIGALLNLNRIDAADEALRDPALRGNVVNDIEVARLEKKLNQIKRSITGEKGQEPARPSGANDFLPTEVNWDSPAELAKPEVYRKALDELRRGEAMLIGDSAAESQWTIKQRIREATALFVLEKTPAPDKIRASLAELEYGLAWAREHGDGTLVSDALWGMYLSYNRLRDSSRAADALLALKSNLEERRAGIADPLERGGVFGDYKYLFDALCEKLQESRRIPDLLEAIEAAKGRGIADILTEKAGKPVADADIYAAVRTIPELAAEHGFHYLTFHVDEERTYAVLVTKDGQLHSPDPVPLGKEMIRETAGHADPRDWGQPSDQNPAVRLANACEALAPLVAWLEPLVNEGRIESGDHLCFVADEDLANVPLHYLRFAGGTLADYVSVSKIHGAFHLDLLLNAPDAGRPSNFFAIVVPTRQNTSQSNWAARKKAMWQPVEWLRGRMTGDDVADANADLAAVSGWPLQHRILHLSTHGVFPADRTPFEHCGVVLAHGGALPDETVVAAGEDLSAVLTPSKVLDFGLDLAGSHVSLMSCVSGLSREGRGGDALGLEWALIQAGATSVLASHWFVSARLAAEFFEHFYEHWISEGKSRADAHSEAMRDMKAAHGEDHTDAWAAFSLVGDWR